MMIKVIAGGCNEIKMMMPGGRWCLLYPAGPLYCYWPTLITLLPTLDDTDDNYDDNKMKEDDYDDQKKEGVDNEYTW